MLRGEHLTRASDSPGPRTVDGSAPDVALSPRRRPQSAAPPSAAAPSAAASGGSMIGIPSRTS
jgi:hypothetical protein